MYSFYREKLLPFARLRRRCSRGITEASNTGRAATFKKDFGKKQNQHNRRGKNRSDFTGDGSVFKSFGHGEAQEEEIE
jgi:hypothetical protein